MEDFIKKNRNAAIFYDDNYLKFTFEFRQQRDYKFDDKAMTNGQRKCRFCNKYANSYKKKAHAVPELLGNKNLISMNECDECNEFFCHYENDLANFLHFELALNGIKGKNGTKTIQSSNLKLKNLLGASGICINALQDSIQIDSENKKLYINCDYTSRTYVPLNVAKILIKSICSVLSYNDLQSCSNTIIWLKSDKIKVSDIPLCYTFISGDNPFGSGRIIILKRKHDCAHLPYIFGIFQFGNFQLQLPMILNDNDNFLIGEKLSYPYYPIHQSESYFNVFGLPMQRIINLIDESPTSKKVNNMVFSFEGIEENIEKDNLSIVKYIDIPQKTACVRITKLDGSTKEYSDFSFIVEQESFKFSHLFLPLNFNIEQKQNNILDFSFSINFHEFKNDDINKIKGINLIIDICEAEKIELTNPKLQPLPFPIELIEKLRSFLSKLYIPIKLSNLLGFKISSEMLSKDFDLQDYNTASQILYFLQNKSAILPAFELNGSISNDTQIPNTGNNLSFSSVFNLNFFDNEIHIEMLFKFKKWICTKKDHEINIRSADNKMLQEVLKVELNGLEIAL